MTTFEVKAAQMGLEPDETTVEADDLRGVLLEIAPEFEGFDGGLQITIEQAE